MVYKSLPATPSTSQLDMRAPVLTRLRRGTGVRWLRIFALILLDTTVLSLAWQTAATYGTPVYSNWNTQHNPLSLVPIIIIQIGLFVTQGLYNSGQKRRDYFSIIKSLIFSHVLLLLLAFFYQPNQFVSRSTFIFSLLLSISFTLIARLVVNTAIEYFRNKGAVRYTTFLICRPEDREKAVNLIRKENCYNLLGCEDIASQAANERNFNDIIRPLQKLFFLSK
jgi:FlaA1/EpsC-like NDP-sugar epimerase